MRILGRDGSIEKAFSVDTKLTEVVEAVGQDKDVFGVEGIESCNMLSLFRQEFAESITSPCSSIQPRSFGANVASELMRRNSACI